MSAVIDASALLAVLLDKPGSDVVLPVLRGGTISAVNLSESCSRGVERGILMEHVLRSITRFEMIVLPFDREQAIGAAELRPATKRAGVSLGDRACLWLARHRAWPLFTGDRRLLSTDAGLGVDIRLIR